MSKLNFSMLRDMVMIYPIRAKAQTDTGIVITSIDKTAPKEGIVVAVGPGKADDYGVIKSAPPFKMGDRVIYALSDIRPVKHGDDEFHVTPATQILAKLEPMQDD